MWIQSVAVVLTDACAQLIAAWETYQQSLLRKSAPAVQRLPPAETLSD